MAVIALDTATPTLALAIGDLFGNIFATQSLRIRHAHAALLHPLLDGLMDTVGVAAQDVEGVAVGVGPGSYTGVRIGVTAAKMIAYQLDVPVVGVSSLSAAAYAARGAELIAAVFDARRGDAYAGAYAQQSGIWKVVLEERRVPCATLARELTASGASRIALVGDAADAVLEQLPAESREACAVYERIAHVRAEHVYELALPELARRSADGKEGGYGQDAHILVPRYLQLAEAEARWRARHRTSARDDQ